MMILNIFLDAAAVLLILALPFLLGGSVFVAGGLVCDAWRRHRERKQAKLRAARRKAYTEDMFRQIRNVG